MENRKKEFGKIKLENYKTSIESIIYNSKPNLRYKENIVNDFKHDYWIFDNFDIYYTYDIKFNLFLVYACDDNNNINIVRLEDKKLIKSLKGHEDIVDIVKHFYNEINNKNYLLSADYRKIVIVWDLNKYKKIHIINTNYSNNIYSLTILFIKNYIITSTEGTANEIDSTKIYSLIDGKIIMYIKQTSKYETLNLLIWKYNNNYYLIELCFENIFIYDLSNGKLFKYLTLSNKSFSYFYSGYISYDNKYLYTCTNEGIITIWNLFDSTLVFKTEIKNLNLLKITLWSTEIKEKKNISNEKEEKKIINYIYL
jgi:WD40 repeat protein